MLLNGVDIRELNRREYYACISGVFQDNSLLPGSVAENITLSETVTDTEKVNDCIEKAGLTEFVSALPKGLNTHYGKELYLDGVEFSRWTDATAAAGPGTLQRWPHSGA